MTLRDRQQALHAAILDTLPPSSLGLAIYHSGYRERLLDTLRAMFPALRVALGEELFDDFGRDFIERDPPRGPTLERLAERFPLHLAATRPDEPWAAFVVELAQLEAAFREVYDGAGIEGREPAAPHEPLDGTPHPSPALRLFHFTFPVDAYLSACRRGEQPQVPDPRETFVAMTRRRFRVTLHALTAHEHALATRLDGTRTPRACGEVDADRQRRWTAAGFYEAWT